MKLKFNIGDEIKLITGGEHAIGKVLGIYINQYGAILYKIEFRSGIIDFSSPDSLTNFNGVLPNYSNRPDLSPINEQDIWVEKTLEFTDLRDKFESLNLKLLDLKKWLVENCQHIELNDHFVCAFCGKHIEEGIIND